MLQRKVSQWIGIGNVLGEWEGTILNRVMREGLPEKVKLGLKQNKTKQKPWLEGGRAPWRMMWGKSIPGSRYGGPEAGDVRLFQKQKEDQCGWSSVREGSMAGAEDRGKVDGQTDEAELRRPIQSLWILLWKGNPLGSLEQRLDLVWNMLGLHWGWHRWRQGGQLEGCYNNHRKEKKKR